MNTIGDRLNIILKETNCKKVEFASRLQIDQSYVTQLVKGRRNPSNRLISDICREFHVNGEWLRNGAGEMFAAAAGPDGIDIFCAEHALGEFASHVIHKFDALPAPQKAIIRGFIETAVQEYNSEEGQRPTDAGSPAAPQSADCPEPLELGKRGMFSASDFAASIDA